VQVRGPSEVLAGLLFAGCGGLALYLGSDYPMGSAMRMGPGYFPAILGGLLTLFGCILLVRGLLVDGERPGQFALVPMLLVLAAIGIFALAVERLGIVIAVVLVIVVSSLASGEFRWKEQLALNAIMVALAVAGFTYGLGLPFKVLPG
jgi:putative tricarboxylic transport membrane protein